MIATLAKGLGLGAAGLLLVTLLSSSPSQPRGGHLQPLVAALAGVSGINLAQGLNLSADQLARLEELAGKSRLAWETFNQQVDRDYPEVIASVAALRQPLSQGQEPPSRLLERAQAAAGRMRQHHHVYESQMGSLTGQAMALLTPNQMALVGDFSPCLVLPNEKRHPERVGQVVDAGPALMILGRVRRFSENGYRENQQSIAGRVDDLRIKHGLPRGNRAEELERIQSLFQRSRGLSEADFALESPELARQLLKVPQTPTASGPALAERVQTYLLHPEMVEIYHSMKLN